MAGIIDIVLDSLEKVEKFSNNSSTEYRFWPTGIKLWDYIPNLYTAAGDFIQIKDLFNTVKDSNAFLSDYWPPGWQTQPPYSNSNPFVYKKQITSEKLSTTKPIEKKINLRDFNEPCFKGDVGVFETIQKTTFPIIKMKVIIDNNNFVTSFRSEPIFIGEYDDLPVIIEKRKPIPGTEERDCSACDCGKFYAVDYDFGEVEHDNLNLGRIGIFNRGGLPLRVTDINPKDHPNFKIGEFTKGLGWSPFTKSPTDGPFDMPVHTNPNDYKEYAVEYVSNGEFDVEHNTTLTYDVETIEQNPIKVVVEKVTTELKGRTQKIDVVCSDMDWGVIAFNDVITNKQITIENKGSKSVFFENYRVIPGKNNNLEHFKVISLPKNLSSNPIEIKSGTSYTINVSYDSLDFYEQEHTAVIEYDFYTIEGFYSKKRYVTKSKIVSYLKAKTSPELISVFDPVIDTDPNGTYTVKTLSLIRDQTARIVKKRTYPLWKCRKERLTQFYTGSNGQKNDMYYLSVYDKPVDSFDSNHEFDISYGHINGSGSSYIQNGVDLYPSKVMYKKYLVEVHGNTTGSFGRSTKFHFKNGINGDSVYFIQTHRDQFKDLLDPGNFELSLVPLSSSANQLYNTGSNFYVDNSSKKVFTLIDDSGDSKQDRTDRSGLDTFYYLVSGSRRDGVYGEPEDNAWGLVFPKMGLFILDGVVLDNSCSFNTVTASINGDNPMKLFLSISGSATTSVSRSFAESFYARSAETALVETYFCRALPEEFNHSNNPTYVGTSLNTIRYNYFLRDPHTIITTIGLYNTRNELVAIGKLKKPVIKNDRTQYTFQVRVRIM